MDKHLKAIKTLLGAHRDGMFEGGNVVRAITIRREIFDAIREVCEWFEMSTLTPPEEPTTLDSALADVFNERERQDAKWGPQNHPDFSEQAAANPSEDRSVCLGMVREHEAKTICQDHFARGVGSWSDIMVEEVVEAFSAPTTEALRTELVQVAAVAVAWIEAIDRRKVQALPPTHFVLKTNGQIFLKTAEFFRSQNGYQQEWGKDWVPVHAKSIEEAREIGRKQ